ncbi:MAG: hypothetical protein COV70_01270 [Parcubacteria group bacterium CG11_big_fil_rev_8_21_14_0_20_39_22]|nr:MAG: hypothetical protein COV70_01270 [Parcubacteria group bacterium CG11_big_fil_rev_8_21_14_0_20_39_22]
MKNNIPLIIGIGLPIVFVVIIFALVFVPSSNINPQYNFVYIHGNSYPSGYYEYTFDVVEGKIVRKEAVSSAFKGDVAVSGEPELYVYDFDSDSSKRISFDEVSEFTLDPGPASPDGYTVMYDYGHNGIFEIFGSDNSRRGYFVFKGNTKKKIDDLTVDRYYGYDMNVLGWIIK